MWCNIPSYPDNITIKRLESTDLGSGSFSEVFSTLSNPKARVQPVSAKEQIRSGRKVSEKAFDIYLPVSIDIAMKDRVIFDSNTLEIVELEKYPGVYIKAVGILA